MQAELFSKDKYGVAKCMRCNSVGTIVQMEKCCRIWDLLQADQQAREAMMSVITHGSTQK